MKTLKKMFVLVLMICMCMFSLQALAAGEGEDPYYTIDGGEKISFEGETLADVYAAAGTGGTNKDHMMVVELHNIDFDASHLISGRPWGRGNGFMTSEVTKSAYTIYKFYNCTFDYSGWGAGEIETLSVPGVQLYFEKCSFYGSGLNGIVSSTYLVDVYFKNCNFATFAITGLAGDVTIIADEDGWGNIGGGTINVNNGQMNSTDVNVNSFGAPSTFKVSGVNLGNAGSWSQKIYARNYATYDIDNCGFDFFFYKSNGYHGDYNGNYAEHFEYELQNSEASATYYETGNKEDEDELFALYAFTPAKVYYDANGGTGSVVDDTDYAPGAEFIVKANAGSIIRSGYKFVGWNTMADGSGMTYEENKSYNYSSIGIENFSCETITLYAQWEESTEIDWHAKEITITTPEQLVEFAQVGKGGAPCNHKGCEVGGQGNHTFEGQTIKLGNNIDLSTVGSEEGWWYYDGDKDIAGPEIDNRIVDFKGIFDGGIYNENGECIGVYIISNMKYYDCNGSESESTNSFVSLGMFRTLYGTVKNLTIATVGGHKLDSGSDSKTNLDPLIAEGPRVAFFPLAYKTRGALIENVKAIDVNVKIDNAGYTYEQDALTSVNGLVGVVTWDNETNDYGNTTQYSRFEGCTVEKFFAEITGNCGYAGGAFAYKASEMSTFTNCYVYGADVTIGGSVDNYGGFIGEIGLASTVTNCGVADFRFTADQNNRAVGGFMGDTVGGTGWGDSVHITNCWAKDSSITVNTLNAPIGGFVGDLIGGRSAIFTDNRVEAVALTATNKGAGDGIGTPCIGGFIGGLYGRSDLTASSEHQFTGCAASATINAGDAPAGGFVGAAVMGDNNQMRVVFTDCTAGGSVTSTGVATGFGFIGTGDIGSKDNGDKNYDEYIRCSTDANVTGLQPVGIEQVAIIGGNYSYKANLTNNYVQLAETINGTTTYTVFQKPEAADTVTIEFYVNGELWRTIELFKGTALDGTNYAYGAEYRLSADALAELFDNFDAGEDQRFLGWFTENDEQLKKDTVVNENMKVSMKSELDTYKVTYQYGDLVPEGAPALPEAADVLVGADVTVMAAPSVDGYTFSGWVASVELVDGKMPEQDVTFVGTWTKIEEEPTEDSTESTESTEEETENIEDEKVPENDKPVVDETPETGDATFVWLLAAVVSCMCMIAVIMKKRELMR